MPCSSSSIIIIAMFDVISPGAQYAVQTLSNVLLDSQVPMPDPNDAARKKTKVADLTTQRLAKRRSQDFKDKIAGWNVESVTETPRVKSRPQQSQDEIVVIHDDESVVKSGDMVVVETESTVPGGVDQVRARSRPTTPKTAQLPTKTTPKTAPTTTIAGDKKVVREVDLDRKAWVRRKSKPQVEVPADVKEAIAPKKRIVSDGHWRRDRTAQPEAQGTPEKENERTPKPVYIRKSVVNVGLKVPVSHQDFTESEPEPDPVRVRPLKSRSPHGRERIPDYESRGTKVYIQRRRRYESESSFTAPSSATDKPSTATTDITSPSSSPPRPKSAPRERLKKMRSGEDEPERPSTARRSKTPVEESVPQRHPSTTAEAFAKRITQRIRPTEKPPNPVPKVYGHRIEGWLNGMSDPFDETLTPEPLAIPKKKAPTQDRFAEDTPESRKSSAKRRSPRDEPVELHSSGKRDLKDGLEESSPLSPASPTLRRRGARHRPESPLKNRTSKDLPPVTTCFDDATMSGGNPDAPRERRRVPSTKKGDRYRIPSGHKLSTIASEETLASRDLRHSRAYPDDATTITRTSDGDVPRRISTKRRVAKHDDLISVLSIPRDEGRRVVPAKSIRRSRRKPGASTVADIMNEVSADELKYQRELRTLVEGVIPVLLKHVVSGSSDSSPGSRVSSRPTTDPSVTRPIVDMGVALERLKTTHKHIPLHEPSELLTWAQAAAKDYSGYLQAWRLGFKDIVVNLAPASASQRDGPSWDHDLPRNQDGDLVDSAGERVDVAYLLKRPLVRIKYLAKTFKDISQLQPSANAADMTKKYQDLVSDAKNRITDEHARLEDEAASNVDATRARDPRSLAPITGVSIDRTRSVRARDYFDMDLVHSSGQQLGCKIEVIYRDDAPNRGKAGDVLFCEISVSGRWLLFPPLPHALVSARKGDRPGELIVMIRGFMSNARQWRETMSLRSEDDNTAEDWLRMLGSSPMPPKLARKSSFNMYKQNSLPVAGVEEPKLKSITETPETDTSRDPSPREIEVPIGERSKATSRIWDGSDVNSVLDDGHSTPTHERPRPRPARYRGQTISSPSASDSIHYTPRDHAAEPQYFYDKTRDDSSYAPSRRGLKTKHVRSQSEWTGSTVSSDRSTDYSVWMPPEDASRYSDESSDGETIDHRRHHKAIRPGMHRRTSSVPSLDMPSIPKIRESSRPDSPPSDRDGLPSQKRAYETTGTNDPSSAPPKLQQRLSVRKRSAEEDRARPATPPHKEKPRPLSLGQSITNKFPSFTPAFMRKNRRPSSPLKHEYAPSSASDSLSDSDYSDYDDDESMTSESTAQSEGVPEDGVSTIGDLQGFDDYKRMGPKRSSPPATSPVTDPNTQLSTPDVSLGPSESASQAPYRTVPATAVEPAKVVASISAWSERGAWDSLHMEECQIFVTPGLIEAFDLTQANSVAVQTGADGSTPSAKGIKPLIALELTPLVPLRRSTAVDLTVRSPPTANSLYKPGPNIMFRLRSPEDCEKLYTLLNRARIDNPTYVALQNARGPMHQSNWGEIMDHNRNAQMDKRRSWWNMGSRKSSTYRSSGSRAHSTAATESSVETMNTAFSALRRFNGSSKIFDLAKSTIASREGTRSTNSGSLNSGTATPDLHFDPAMGTPLGITGAKVRLYVRESASKWRDLGSARLTVMLPPRRPDPSSPASPKITGLEKRIVVSGKSQNHTLLDVTLGESAFERIARTGIAVSVYEGCEHVGVTGGVLPNRTTCYMIQMKSERDAAYTFGLVGKLRY